MTVSNSDRKVILNAAKYTSITTAASAYGVSRSSIRNWAKTKNITLPTQQVGRKRHPKLRNIPIPPHKNTISRHRYYMLHVYKYTCYDCGLKDSTGKKLQQHADYNKFPVEVLILCTACHGKRERHDKNPKTTRLG